MKISCKIIAVLLLFLGSTLSASSLTILIETRDPQPRATMELPRRLSIVSAETGVMDSLFDGGHIFFNIYTPGVNPADGSADRKTLNYAGDEGAAYLLILVPDPLGISWKLYDVPEKSLLSTDFVSLDVTDPELKTDERWLALGSRLAEDVLVKLR